jgi:hypothetical protein
VYSLITAASTAKAYQLKNTLQNGHVFLGDHHDLPEVMVKAGKMLQLPDPGKEAYPHQMLALCLDHEVDTLYILRSEEAIPLAESELLFDEYGIKLVFVDDQVQ